MEQVNDTKETLAFRTFEEGGNSVIEVADSGPGVDTQNFSKIFDPFFTLKDKGVGLGRSIAHKIASQHGPVKV